MHVIKVTDGKWKCGEYGGIGKKTEGSETIKRKASNNLTLSCGHGSQGRVGELNLYSV